MRTTPALLLLRPVQTKWAVSATVFAVLLWQHNEYAAWCVVGAVFSSFVCKVGCSPQQLVPGDSALPAWQVPATPQSGCSWH